MFFFMGGGWESLFYGGLLVRFVRVGFVVRFVFFFVPPWLVVVVTQRLFGAVEGCNSSSTLSGVQLFGKGAIQKFCGSVCGTTYWLLTCHVIQ